MKIFKKFQKRNINLDSNTPKPILIGGPTGRGRNTLMSDLLKAKNKKPSLFQTMNNFINDCLYSYLRTRNYFRLNFEKPIEFFIRIHKNNHNTPLSK